MNRILILLLALIVCVSFMASCQKDDDGVADDNTNQSTDNSGGTVNNNGNSGNSDNTNNNSGQQSAIETDLSKYPGVDYFNDDLSDYVEIDEKYYKGYTVEVDPDRVSALDVENKIIQALCKYKDKEKVSGDGIISVGDVVNIYYKGYYMKDGAPYYFDGGSNMGDTKPYSLEIGSGAFILGFEYNLIGKNPAEYTEESPIVVETFFPENYQAAELAGVTAYFVVKVDSIEEYNAPELNESFITETLKMDADSLSDYEGEGLVEKYKSYLYEQVMYENGLDVETLTINAFWDSVMKGVVIKKYPERQIKENENAIIYELEYVYYYQYYSYYYKYDDFMCLYLGLEVGTDWKALVNEYAKEQVAQQLVFYHIMNLENMKPDADEYDVLFDEYLASALESSDIKPEKYDTDEAYQAAKEEYKKKLIESKGEEYFKSMIYYKIGIEKIISYANVVELGE